MVAVVWAELHVPRTSMARYSRALLKARNTPMMVFINAIISGWQMMENHYSVGAPLRRRPTVEDIARVAGVSVATVDRVINNRLPVKKQTAERVLAAAEQIGYHATGVIRRRLEQALPYYRLGFLLQRPEQVFYQNFAEQLRLAAAAATQFRVDPKIEFLKSQKPAEVAEHMKALAKQVDAIGVATVDHPTITAAVRELKSSGVPVFSLLSDFAASDRYGYVGTDNRKVGRTAGWFAAKTSTRPGKVAIFVGDHGFPGHELREIGFRSYLREAASDLAITDTQLTGEDVDHAERITRSLLKTFPDLTSIYVAGGGMEGVISALRDSNSAGRVTLICNELTPFNRAALAEGIVTALIGTPLELIARTLLDLMASAISTPKPEGVGQIFVPFNLYVSENI
jgi:LacI family transcriptional regulator